MKARRFRCRKGGHRMRRIACVMLPVLALLSLGASDATAMQTGWWHLSLSSRAATIQPGSAVSEQQEISSHSSEVAFEIHVNGVAVEKPGAATSVFATEPYAHLGFPEPTPENIQEALEGAYGAGNVTVIGGPLGTAPLVVRSTGADADRQVGPIEIVNVVNNTSAAVSVAGHPDGEIVLTAANLGDAAINGGGSAVKLATSIPAGLKPVSISGLAGNESHSPGPVNCSLESLSCSFTGELPPFSPIEVVVGVLAEPQAESGEVASATASGGGVRGAATSRPVAIGTQPSPFGIEDYEVAPEEEGGELDTQASSHPFQLTTTIAFNERADRSPVQLAKDVRLKWPAGMIGNPTAVPKCTLGQFLHFTGLETLNECSSRSAVGVALVTIKEPLERLGPKEQPFALTVPVFNLEPARGEPARFGFLAPGSPVVIDTSVRSGGDYGVTIDARNISQTAALLRSEVTIWGTPGDASHDNARGNGCLRDVRGEIPLLPCNPLEEPNPAPFLSLAPSCGTSMETSIQADSWVEPHPTTPAERTFTLGALDGCERVPFSPSITVLPDNQRASSPTGLSVDVTLPPDVSPGAGGLAQDDVRRLTVTLPEGLSVNPSSADGLLSCAESQVGFLAGESSPGNLHLTDEPASCPDQAKIGTVKIQTPVLPDPLEGFVYLAAQNANPFGSLLAIYIVAQDPVSGVLVKLPGEVKLTAQGQLIDDQQLPEVPFGTAELHFFTGDRAPLSTPAHCGTYTTHATFSGWAGNTPVSTQSSFQITSGPGGGPCPGVLPFRPSISAGTASNRAGAFTPLTTAISRDDGDQDLRSVSLRMPPGLAGIVASVAPCAEVQANAGTCGSGSLIGSAIASAGVGGDPYTVRGGQVFLTGPYEGAPFGLSITMPAKAGPFDLGTVVVRAKLEVDKHTAQIVVSTDGEGPYAIPSILQGIPLQLRLVDVTIDRPGFTFNPTNCKPLAVAATLTSTESAIASASAPFQVTNCAALKFQPKFSVSTNSRTSKANGASLVTKLTYPRSSLGSQANIASAEVTLPKQLPSRLTTLQKACVAAVYEADPAHCPAGSIIGHAKVLTPVLPVPLTGPAYFVSHGNEAFPSLTILLHGDNVTIELVGATAIHRGITTTTFKTTPDVPFSSFELVLPQGRYSALAAIGNLCRSKLRMPTLFTAQNGLQLHGTTKITVGNCPKHKKHKRGRKRRR